jgi:hypothetical protein
MVLLSIKRYRLGTGRTLLSPASQTGIWHLSVMRSLGCAPAPLYREHHMQQRSRFKQARSLKQRLLARVRSLREEAKLLPPGALRDGLLRQARQADTAAHIDGWLRSSGLQPPS